MPLPTIRMFKVPGWLDNTVPVKVTCSMNVNLPVKVSMMAIAVAGPVPWKSPVKVSVLVMRATRVLPVLLRTVSCKLEAVAWPVTNVGFAVQA